MKMHLLIEDEPNKQMKNQALLLGFLDWHQVVIQLTASSLHCTILSQDSHPVGRQKRTVNKITLLKNMMHFDYFYVHLLRFCFSLK